MECRSNDSVGCVVGSYTCSSVAGEIIRNTGGKFQNPMGI